MENRYAKYIAKAIVRSSSEIKFHLDTAPGFRYLFLDRSLIEESSLYAIVRSVTYVQTDQSEYVLPHAHQVDSSYLLIGDNKDLTGLTAELNLGGEKYVVESPTSVFIPRGLKHSYRLIGGRGKYVNIVLSGDYNDTVSEEC